MGKQIKQKDVKHLWMYTVIIVFGLLPVCIGLLWFTEVTPLFIFYQGWLSRQFPTQFTIPKPIIQTKETEATQDRIIIILDDSFGFSNGNQTYMERKAIIYAPAKARAIDYINDLYDVNKNTQNSITSNLCTCTDLILSVFLPNGYLGSFPEMQTLISTFNNSWLMSVNNEYHQQTSYHSNALNKPSFYGKLILPALYTTKKNSRILQKSLNLVIVKTPHERNDIFMDRSQNVILLMTNEISCTNKLRTEVDLAILNFYRLEDSWAVSERQAIQSIMQIVVHGRFQRMEISENNRWKFLYCIEHSEPSFAMFALKKCLEQIESNETDISKFVDYYIFKFPLEYKIGVYFPLFFPFMSTLVAAWIVLLKTRFIQITI